MAGLDTVIGWLSVREVIGDDNAAGLWADAPGEEADGYAELASMMGTAHEVLETKGPAMDPPPERYKTAQLLYMKHLWQRSRAGNGEQVGADGLAVSTWPLVQEAYGLMRLGRRGIRGLR